MKSQMALRILQNYSNKENQQKLTIDIYQGYSK